MRKRQITRFTTLLLVYIIVFTLTMAHVSTGKLSGSISITASPTNITIGESTTISGSITPANVGETVTIWRRIGAAPWGILTTAITNGTGQYSHVWTVSGVGTYKLKATWIGEVYAAESSIITVYVKASPVASFIHTPDTATVDETVTFNASASYDSDGTIVSYFWDFGDETNGTGVTTTHAYTAAGTYNVTLTVTDNDTLTDTETKFITVSPQPEPPVASFTYSPTEPQVNETITFNASASYDSDGTIVSYFWDFGDETNGTNEIATHTYVDNGTYSVILNVTDNHGLSNTTSKNITVLYTPPIAVFTESAETVYTNEVITFNASDSHDPDGNITSYFWDFGDGKNATDIIVEHFYEDDGYYNVTLTVMDSHGTLHNATAIKTVLNRSPMASFIESAETVDINENIQFNASQSVDLDGSIVGYFWDFDDGTNDTGAVVNHAYSDNGNYTVTLTVTDDDGATGTATANKIVLNKAPVAIFTESTETAYAYEAITFNASDSYDPDGNIANYYWNFGDETNAIGVVVSHAYVNNGTFVVVLTVTDDDGASNSTSSTKTILINESPVPLFTASAQTVHTSEAITFNASDSYDPDGTVIAYLWDFGDGTNATGEIVGHSYADNGVFTVTLTVTDDRGGTASKSATNTVSNRPPIALFTQNATIVLTDEFVHFDASSSNDPDGSIVSYFWDFGDRTHATGVTVNHAYEDDGVYTAILTVTDDDGGTASKSATNTVSNRPPIALFTQNATIVDIDELIRFDASDSYDPDGSILSYFWEFGDETNVSMCMLLGYAYTENGNYTVTLTVADDDGASSSASITITVNSSSGWPLSLVAGIALGITALTGTAVYAVLRRKKKTGEQAPIRQRKSKRLGVWKRSALMTKGVTRLSMKAFY